MTPQIAQDIETVLEFVRRYDKFDADPEVINAATNIEVYLATYRDDI